MANGFSYFSPKEDVEEFAKLSPEEQQKRLKAIIKKIDGDADGLLTEGMTDDFLVLFLFLNLVLATAGTCC